MEKYSFMCDNRISAGHIRSLYIMALTHKCDVGGLIKCVYRSDEDCNCRPNQHGSLEQQCCCVCSCVKIRNGRHVVVNEGTDWSVNKY
jgi:hypothetical protein